MKQFLLVLFFALLFAGKSGAQQSQCTKPVEVATSKRVLWLYNSEGKVVGEQDSIVSKAYFTAATVFLQSDLPFTANNKLYCVFQGATPYAHYFSPGKLPHEIINRINKTEQGTAITFIVEEKKETEERKAVKVLQIVLKE